MSLRRLRSVGCSMVGPRDPKALEQLERFRRRTALPAQRADDAGWPQNNPSSALEQLRRAAEAARLTEQQNQEMQARGQELASRVTEVRQGLGEARRVVVIAGATGLDGAAVARDRGERDRAQPAVAGQGQLRLERPDDRPRPVIDAALAGRSREADHVGLVGWHRRAGSRRAPGWTPTAQANMVNRR